MGRQSNCTTPLYSVLLSHGNYGVPLIQRPGYGPLLAISDDGFNNYTASLFCRTFDPQATVVKWQFSSMVGVDYSEYLAGASALCGPTSTSLWSCLSITNYDLYGVYVSISRDLFVSCMRPCAASALDPQTNCTQCTDRSMNASSFCTRPLGSFMKTTCEPAQT